MKKHERARELRRNLTEAEKKLWHLLRNRQLSGIRFRRQRPVGPYYLDFACTEYSLAIELDGGQHNGSERDIIRTAYLEAQGWKVVRFWNNEVLENIEGVYQTIVKVLEVLSVHPHPTDVPSVDLSRSAGEV